MINMRARLYGKNNHNSLLVRIIGYFCLSWLYALCSQITIPLPFSAVPLSLQPAPLMLAAHFFGFHAVVAYGLYLAQGALGAPFFAGMQGGLVRLMGPTGGYLIGFGLAMIFIAAVRRIAPRSVLVMLLKVYMANVFVFTVGLCQLAFFVPADKVIALGLYPFIIGDFVIKPAINIMGMKGMRFMYWLRDIFNWR
jgi:biotin transport system substrate-specific component